MANGIQVPVASMDQPRSTPSPQVNTYRPRVQAGGQIAGRFTGGPGFQADTSAGEGLAAFGRGLGQVGNALEVVVQRRQNLEAMRNIQDFQDKERLALEQMQEMKGTDGFDNALQFMDNFYKTEGEKLLENSRGQFQEQLYQRAVMQSRDMGMNRAMNHRISELDRAEAAYYQGQVDREMTNIEQDPDNAAFYLDNAKANVARANPGVDNTSKFLALDASAKASLKNNANAKFQALLISDPEAAMAMYEEGTKAPARSANLPNVSAGSKLTQDDLRVLSQDPNVRKILDAISWAEGADYGTLVGGGQFSDFSRHPKKSVHIGRLGINSTAAGRYQFVGKTWDGLAKEFGFTDFSPETQDMAAVALLQRRGVLQDVLAGNWEKVVNSQGMSQEWASFPKDTYGQGGKSAQALMTRLGAPSKSEWSGLFSPEEMATMKNQATQAIDGKYISDQVGRYEQTLFVGTPQEQAKVISEISNEISKVQDPERQALMLRDLNTALSNIATINGANDMKAQEDFLAQATQEGWNASQMLAQVDNIKGMTRDSKDKLRQNIQADMVNKTTPQNEANLGAIMVAIDQAKRGPNGKPLSREQTMALALQGGLTVEQTKKAVTYWEQGGINGQEGLAGDIKSVIKQFNPEFKGDPSAPLIDSIARRLPAGKKPSIEEIQKATAEALLPSVGGYIRNDSIFGIFDNDNETYQESAAAGKADDWLPDVTTEEEPGIDLELQAAGLAVNDRNRAVWKKSERMGLPLSEADKKAALGE